MKKNYKKLLLPALVVSSLALSGCGEKKDCEIPTSHVHKYTKKITNDIRIIKYLQEEYSSYWDYDWNPEYFEITKEDEKFFSISKNLFKASDNWDYLYYLMKSKKDFLEFYYRYITTETYTVTDGNGKTHLRTRAVTRTGWTDNPTYSHNTGKVRLGHHKYYSFYIEYHDGKYYKKRSPLVDDIREVLKDYPYTEEDCYEIVYDYYQFSSIQLPFLKPEQFNSFKQPDFSNSSMYFDSNKVLKK